MINSNINSGHHLERTPDQYCSDLLWIYDWFFSFRVSVKSPTVLHICKLLEFLLLKEHADFWSFSWLLLGEHFVDIAQIQITLNLRNKWRWHLSLVHCLPVNTVEKDVILQIICTTWAKSFFGISLEQASKQAASFIWELGSHLNITICNHLQLLKFVLVPQFKGIDSTKHFVNHEALNTHTQRKVNYALIFA